MSFAGPNLWRPYGDRGQPFGNHADVSTPVLISQTTPGIGPLELRNPVLWLAVAGLAVLLARRRLRGFTPDRAVLAVAVAGGVALLLAAFTLAPLRQAPGASVASNLAALIGDGCGFADAVTVLDGAGTAPRDSSSCRRSCPAASPRSGWGYVERVVYDHPTGGYDLTVDPVRRAGWTRLPTLVGEAYTGRGFIG